MSDNRDLGRRFLGAMMGLNAPPPFDEPPERTPRHHVIRTFLDNTTAPPQWRSYVVDLWRDEAITDEGMETQDQALVIALYRDIQAGYVPTPGELAGTDWSVLVGYLGEDGE